MKEEKQPEALREEAAVTLERLKEANMRNHSEKPDIQAGSRPGRTWYKLEEGVTVVF